MLSDPQFQDRVYGIAKMGELLWHLQNRRIFEVLGTAYYHSVLPLIPPADWPKIVTWRGSPPNWAILCCTQRNAAI